jgi:DNA-binding beta-propeller fold protein YncE
VFAIGSSFAANPISGPRGIALDSKGNLYVANQNANQVLVYNPSYKQVRTISQNVISPTGVAVDPQGNVWVANYSGSITVYSSTGVQDPTRTIINNIIAPEAIACDGLGDIWVNNDYVYVTVYPAFGGQIATYHYPNFVYGIATHEMWFANGSNPEVSLTEISPLLTNAGTVGLNSPGNTGFALAFDATGNLYIGNLDQSVKIISNGGLNPFLSLSYVATGLAVDSSRGRVYIANQNGNEVQVYNTSGTLLTTLH